MPSRRAIIHLIPSLKIGGAERMLYKFTSQDPSRHVICFFEGGPVVDELVASGVKIKRLRGFFDFLSFVKAEGHDSTVVAWLYKACLIASVVKLLIPTTRVFFNHRNSLEAENSRKISRKIVLLLLRITSRYVDGAIFNSNRGLESYVGRGILAKRHSVIPNGFDLSIFYPSEMSKGEIRRNNGFVGFTGLIYVVSARNSAEKQLSLIVDVFHEFSHENPTAALVVCGTGSKQLSIPMSASNIFLMGEVEDMTPFYQMSDFSILYSLTEGFPNVIGEAMACGIPCITSEVGDCGRLVEDSGWVCSRGSRHELLAALRSSANISGVEYALRSTKAAKVIADAYSIEAATKKFLGELNEYN